MSRVLDGKVVLITGAGNGIGRAHALACAAEGARVVVNDLGGARDGTGVSTGPAQQVVDVVRAAGGEAVANTDSVTDPEGCARMVQVAIDTWGRLDAVVNNAGILRDKTFVKLTEEEWDLVVAVHLKGTHNVLRAAVPALQKQGGAIVNTTSYSGLIGNFGQSNYAAAKAGIYGLSRVLALELQKSGVAVNCVAPIAKTRMTAEISMVEDEWTPEQISPIVVFLCSDAGRRVTGKVFGVQGQRLHAYEMKVNEGVEKPGKELWSPEEIGARLDDILRFDMQRAPAAASGPSPVREVFALAPLAFKADQAADWAARIHFDIKDGPGQTLVIKDGRCVVEEGLTGSPDCVVKTDTETIVGIFKRTVDPTKAFMKGRITADNLTVMMKFSMSFDFDAKRQDATSPASPGPRTPSAGDAGGSGSVGGSTPAAPRSWPIGKVYDGGAVFAEPAHAQAYAAATNDLDAAYEGVDAICPPMFHVRLLQPILWRIATDPELELDVLRLVHGEHDATFHHPIRPWDLVQCRGKLLSVEEKSSGLLVTSGLYGFVDGRLAVECRTAYFIRGRQRGDAKETPKAAPASPPPPDLTVAVPVAADQSYRYAEASLDRNPIHVDPDTARAAGLPDVILHGLCTMALTGRALVDTAGGGDPRRLRRLGVRFARPVSNGTTLTVNGWRGADGAWTLETRDSAGNVVISNAIGELR